MTKEELRREYNRPSFKQALKNYHGDRCVNCGSDDRIEFHHIVPIANGGTNCITNVVPLCYECHKRAHEAHKIAKKHAGEHGGRKVKDLNDLENNVQRYINCEIGTREFKQLVGLPKKGSIRNSKALNKYLNSIGIKTINNNVDWLNCPKGKNFKDKIMVEAQIEYL